MAAHTPLMCWIRCAALQEEGDALAVVCENEREELFQTASSLCQFTFGLHSAANDVELDVSYTSPRGLLHSAIRDALEKAGGRLGELAPSLNIVIGTARGNRAVGLGWNRRQLQRAVYFALALSAAMARALPSVSRGGPLAALRKAAERAPRLQCTVVHGGLIGGGQIAVSSDEEEAIVVKEEVKEEEEEAAAQPSPGRRAPARHGGRAAERRRAAVRDLPGVRRAALDWVAEVAARRCEAPWVHRRRRRKRSASWCSSSAKVRLLPCKRLRRSPSKASAASPSAASASSPGAGRRRAKRRKVAGGGRRGSRRPSSSPPRPRRSEEPQRTRRRGRGHHNRRLRVEGSDKGDRSADGKSDEPAVTRLSIRGETLDEGSTLGDVLRVVRVQLVDAAVKQEPEVPQERLSSTQVQLLEELRKGAWRFDPSQAPWAWETQRHLAKDVPVDALRFTHDRVHDKFLNGQHQGQSVAQLILDLLAGSTSAQDLAALVVVVLGGVHWVVCGNRRLKALKTFREMCGAEVQARCIVYHVDRGPVPHPVLAKFLLGASTQNCGTSAQFRHAPMGRRPMVLG